MAYAQICSVRRSWLPPTSIVVPAGQSRGAVKGQNITAHADDAPGLGSFVPSLFIHLQRDPLRDAVRFTAGAHQRLCNRRGRKLR